MWWIVVSLRSVTSSLRICIQASHPPTLLPLHCFFPSVCPLMNMYWVSVIRLHFYKIHSKDICKYAYLSDPPDMFMCRVCKSSEIQAPISSSHSHGLVWSVLWAIFHNTHKGICCIGALEQEYKMHFLCVSDENCLHKCSTTSQIRALQLRAIIEVVRRQVWWKVLQQNLNHGKLRQEICIQLGLIHILQMHSCHRLRWCVEQCNKFKN